jgi:hypothetical protein
MSGHDHSEVTPPEDDLDDSIWDSPEKPVPKGKDQEKASGRSASTTRPSYEEQQSHEENLRQELANVRKVNETIESVIANLERAKGNMKVCDAF